MADDLEKLAEEYDATREKLIQTIANKIDSLAKKVSEHQLEDIFLFEFDNLTEKAYYVTRDGLHNKYHNRQKVEELTETIAYDALDYFQTEDILYYLSRAENQINKIIAQKQGKKLGDMPNFSGFFDDRYGKWNIMTPTTDKEIKEAVTKLLKCTSDPMREHHPDGGGL